MHFKRIRDLREDADLTQKEMSEKLKIAREVYRRYEAGTRTIPVDILIELSRFYQVSTDYLLGLTDKKR